MSSDELDPTMDLDDYPDASVVVTGFAAAGSPTASGPRTCVFCGDPNRRRDYSSIEMMD